MAYGKKKEVKKAGVILSDSEMKKKYHGAGLASDITVVPGDSLWIPSRSLYLNYTTGGGLMYGKVMEIFGGESSGKSLVAMDFAYCTQYLGGIVLWNDAEQAFDPVWWVANGLDLSKVVLYSETSIENVSDWAADMAVTWRSKLTHNEPILLVTDSIAALDCDANINSSQSDAKAEMGNRAKAIYKYLRIRNQLFAELGISTIFINQLRDKVGATMFEDPDCFHYNTKIPLVDGSTLPIGKIVEDKIEANVWSYNELENKFEVKPIIGWVKKSPLEKGEKWLNIITNGPGSKRGRFGITCTPEHGVLTTKGWVNAKNLKEGDKVISKSAITVKENIVIL